MPPNYTSKLQPLDVGLNKPFKDRLRTLYVEYAATIDRDASFYITRQLISRWIADAWEGIPSTAVTNTIRSIGFTQGSF